MKPRHGSFAIDAAVAIALLGALTAVSLQAMSTMAAGRRATENRLIAVQLAAGALERARALTWDELTADRLAAIARQYPADSALSGAQLTLTVDEDATDPAQRHLCAEIQWPNQSPVAKPVKLHYWVARTGSTAP